MGRQRIEYIDVVKGVAIFLMVLGHSYSDGNGENIILWIYSFHMPLFFITTGILYGMRNDTSLIFSIKKKLKTILWPYLFWGTAYQLFLSILKIIGREPIVETIYQNLFNVIKMTGGSMWFLPVMFGSLVISRIFFELSQKKIFYIISSIVIMLLSIIFTTNNEILEILLKMFVGAGFISIGYYFADTYNKMFSVQSLLVLTIAHIMLAFLNSSVSMVDLIFGNPILYILTSSIGTLVIYGWCKKIKADSKISYLFGFFGRNSMKILCLHGFVVQIIRLLDHKLFNDFLPMLGFGEGFFLSAAIITILSIILKLRNPFVEWTFGEKL